MLCTQHSTTKVISFHVMTKSIKHKCITKKLHKTPFCHYALTKNGTYTKRH